MPSSQQIFAVVLAAGRSERFGATKLAAEFDGEALVRRAVRTARRSVGDRVLLVTGHEAVRIIEAAGDVCRFVVVNERYNDGMGTSIAAAARALSNRAGAMLLMLADQPLITSQHLDALLGAWNGAPDAIVATAFAGTLGPPALLPQHCFADLAKLHGDDGARRLLQDARFTVTSVWNDDAALDIDTPADLDQAAS